MTQARRYQGQLAKLAVEGVIECLISIGQLPQGYSPKPVTPCFLARKTPTLLGREDDLEWLRGRLYAPTGEFPAAVIRGGCGDGKSALAMELGMQMYEAGEIPGGAYMIDLAGQYSPATFCYYQQHILLVKLMSQPTQCEHLSAGASIETPAGTFQNCMELLVADRLNACLLQTQVRVTKIASPCTILGSWSSKV